VLAIASFGEGNHDEPPRHRRCVCPRQSRGHGCRPSSPFGWKSLTRVTQPLTFSVASQAPSDNSNCPIAGRNVRFAFETRAATLHIDPFGQDCARAVWFRNSAAHSPERLEPCQTPRKTRGSERLGQVYPLDLRRPHTRSPNLLRDAHVNDASAPAKLDCQRRTGSCDPTRRRPEMLPANSCTPRCQRRAPGLRVVIDRLGAGR